MRLVRLEAAGHGEAADDGADGGAYEDDFYPQTKLLKGKARQEYLEGYTDGYDDGFIDGRADH